MKKSKPPAKPIPKRQIAVLLFLLLAIPVSIFGISQIRQFFGQAASSTFKVTRNHQLACGEQPDWGNIVTVFIKDENGNPLPNTQIDYWPDYPYHASGKEPPPEGVLTTDSAGKAQFANYWPGCLPCTDGQGHRIHFFFKVKGARSDTAVEISSGIYGNECPSPFCPGRSTVNVWGHWGYEIVFRRTAGELAEEEAPTDHAGQADNPNNHESNCTLWHFYTPYQDYNPHRSGSLPTATPTPAGVLPTNTPSPTGFAPSPTPTQPAADCSCEIWAKNYCDGSGLGSYDVFVQKFNTLEECEAYQTPVSYTCNCNELCTTGSGHDANQKCTTGKSENIALGKSKCSSRDFRVQVINPALCTAVPPGSSGCSCEKMDVSGIIAKGQTISLVAYAKAQAGKKVLNMVYHVEKNGREISNSGPIAAVGPDETNRYYTAWNWTIPNTSGQVEYKIRVEINCGPKTGASAATAKQEENLLSSLFRGFGSFFNNLFNLKEIFPAAVPLPPTPMPTGKVFAPVGARSLQLGTFIFSTVTYFEKDCTWLKFRFK